MLRFIIKRLILGFMVLAGVVVSVFLLFHVLPGDPVRIGFGQRADSVMIAAAKAELGLDKPLKIQFITYINDISPISIHEEYDKKHYLYLDSADYSPYIKLISFGDLTKTEQPTGLPRQ